MAHSANFAQSLVEKIKIRNKITGHAWKRMNSRGITSQAVEATFQFGRSVFSRGAEIIFIGRKEVENFSKAGINLSDFEGIQLVCTHDGIVKTVYRNRDLKCLRTRGNRPSPRKYRP